MDANEFAVFLKGKLLEIAKEFDDVLLSVNYPNLESANRLAGKREALISIADSIGNLLNEFHNRHYYPNKE